MTTVQQDLSGWAEKLMLVPGVQCATFLTSDGLRTGGSSNLPINAQDGTAAMGSSLHSTAVATVRAITQQNDTEPIDLRMITVETSDGFLIVMAAGDNTRLVVLTAPSADVGNVAYHMAKLTASLGEKAFAAPARDGER